MNGINLVVIVSMAAGLVIASLRIAVLVRARKARG